MTYSFFTDDDDPVGNPYGVRFEPDDPEELWEEYCHALRARHAARWEWFRAKARRANRRAVERGDVGRITTCDVAALFEKAGGRCHYCESLADQVCPPGGWDHVGRRAGSIDHVDQRGIRRPGAEAETSTQAVNVVEEASLGLDRTRWPAPLHPAQTRSAGNRNGDLELDS